MIEDAFFANIIFACKMSLYWPELPDLYVKDLYYIMASWSRDKDILICICMQFKNLKLNNSH